MSEFSAVLDNAVENGDIPYGVAKVVNRDGVLWSGGSGEGAPGAAADENTVFRLWSMTKAVGSLAAMILVDRGEISMDTKVADVVPEFGKLRVLDSIGQGKPMELRVPKTQATVRHLLTHTSGIAYPMYCEKMLEYMNEAGLSYVMTGTKAELNTPLMFDPGEDWVYGIGYDWVGNMVQEITGKPLDQFCRDEIFEPLHLTRTGFEPEDISGRLARAYARSEVGEFAEVVFAPPAHPEMYMMGSALYGTASDYGTMLRLILGRGEVDGVRVIGEETARLMTENQIGELRIGPIRSYERSLSEDVTLLADETSMSHTGGFLRTEEDVKGRRGAGSLWWAGFLNTHFWIDPKNDIAALFMTQMLPFCDQRCMDTFEKFERAVYRNFA